MLRGAPKSGMLRSELIYEALTDDRALWQLSTRLADAAAARSAVLQFADGHGHADCFTYSYFDAAMVRDYQRDFARFDVWANAGFSAPRNQNRAVILGELVPDSVFERSVFYNEFFRPRHYDTFRCLGAVLPLGESFGLIGIHRGKGEAEFRPADQAVLDAALPHLRRMFSVRSALLRAKVEARLADCALEKLSVLALAVDRKGRVLAAYPQHAEDLLYPATGARFRDGRLCFRHGFQQDWEQLLANATEAATPTGGAMLMGSWSCSRPPIWLEIAPAPSLPSPIAAVVVIRAANATPDLTRSRLQTLLGLTSAEADVAWRAAQGASAEEIAAARDVAVTTVRAQIRNIFAKVECRSLSQLATIVARFAV
jgi:DNA-binding CsgD family transcriptional regulator